MQRIAGLGGKSLQLPVFPAELGLPDYYDERYDPLCGAIQETGLPICCHIGLNTALDDLARRDPTPATALTVSVHRRSTAPRRSACGSSAASLERFPELKVVFVEPGLGWVAWYLYDRRRHGGAPGLRVSGASAELPSFYFHRNMRLTFIDEPDAVQPAASPARRREHHVVDRLPAPGVELAELARHRSRSSSAISPTTNASSSCGGNAARVWNL